MKEPNKSEIKISLDQARKDLKVVLHSKTRKHEIWDYVEKVNTLNAKILKM